GLALKFYASVRIDLRKIANIKTPTGESIGSQHRARIIKNKVAPPFREAEFDIMNTEGISIYGSLVDVAVQHDIIVKAGAFFKVDGQKIQGRESTKNYLRQNPKIAEAIKSQIWKKIKESADLAKPTKVPAETDEE
ncbi:MAG: DNA recombination/repair protein RecA, partial [Candidatus Paceibacterota bacterium]